MNYVKKYLSTVPKQNCQNPLFKRCVIRRDFSNILTFIVLK
jgi:hypothetical protein